MIQILADDRLPFPLYSWGAKFNLGHLRFVLQKVSRHERCSSSFRVVAPRAFYIPPSYGALKIAALHDALSANAAGRKPDDNGARLDA